jgi:hypothetical protein
MRGDENFYGGDVIGKQVTDHHPERHQAQVAARVAAARSLGWPQVDLSDFEVIGNNWRPIFVDKATGVQYRPIAHDPLRQENVAAENVASFLLDAAGQLIFLRVRGTSDAPVRQSVGGRIYSGRLERRDGKYQVVDEATGSTTELGHGAFAA